MVNKLNEDAENPTPESAEETQVEAEIASATKPPMAGGTGSIKVTG
jgi:hypothetical protein